MRTVEEIKADIESCDSSWIDSALCRSLRCELYETILDGIPLDRLEAICAAEKDGRLTTLPCKVGDTVWVIIDGKVWPEYVGSFCIRHGGADFFIHNIGVDNEPEFKAYATINDFGKTVFLTRAEAEAALKESNSTTLKSEAENV